MEKRIYNPPANSPVSYYWEIGSNSKFLTSHTVMPSPFLTMVFPLNNKPIYIEGLMLPVTKPFISPILDSPKEIFLSPDSQVFGLHLKPCFAVALFNVGLNEILKNANLLEDVIRAEIYNELRAIWDGELNFKEKIQLVENIFDKYLIHYDIIIKYSIQKLRNQPHLRIKDLCQDLSYSERWIQKKFKNCLGTSPQEMIQVIRFNGLLKNIYLNPTNNLTQLSLKSGYYDQSHAIREFKKLSNVTPSKFISNLPVLTSVLNR